MTCRGFDVYKKMLFFFVGSWLLFVNCTMYIQLMDIYFFGQFEIRVYIPRSGLFQMCHQCLVLIDIVLLLYELHSTFSLMALALFGFILCNIVSLVSLPASMTFPHLLILEMFCFGIFFCFFFLLLRVNSSFFLWAVDAETQKTHPK